MSYLDLPRIHFGGAFFTNPATINNVISNYDPGTTPSEFNPVWNPNGVSQLYLRGCKVTATVDGNGHTTHLSSGGDALFNGTVQSPSPNNNVSKEIPGGADIPKLVDLDPQQQIRSAVFGMWLVVRLGDGKSGFMGKMSVPFINTLGARADNGPRSSYGSGCMWQGRLTEISWQGDISGSPVLTALKARIESGAPYTGNLSLCLSPDLHNNTASIVTTGNEFCYGRMQGSFAPEKRGDPDWTTICRNLGPAGNAAMNNVYAVVNNLDNGGKAISVDFSNALKIVFSERVVNQKPGKFSDGTLVTKTGWQVGYDKGGTFTAFQNGAIDFSNTASLDESYKQVVWPTNCGIGMVRLNGDEGPEAEQKPLSIQLNGDAYAQEAADGFNVLNLDPVLRLEQGRSPADASASKPWYCLLNHAQTRFQVLRWGKPYADQAFKLPLSSSAFRWFQTGRTSWNYQPGAPDFSLAVPDRTDANGIITVLLSLDTEPLNLVGPRINLHSRYNQITLSRQISSPENNIPVASFIGDGGTPVSVVVFQKFDAPANPTWEADISPILSEYANIYPGMKAILDISDESTVTGPAKAAMVARMGAEPSDPTYMPVTRDLTPSRAGMVVDYLKSQP